MIPVVVLGVLQWCIRVPLAQGEATRQHLVSEGALDLSLKVQRVGDHLLLPVIVQRAGAERCEFEYASPKTELPRHELVGGIAIMQDNDPIGARQILAARPSVHTVVVASGEVSGEYRTREFEILAGDITTRTEVIEYGHRFVVDLTRAYFSSRLSTERQRVLAQVSSEEKILDMFAGVGPFAITLAKKAHSVIAADKNPAAIELMIENLAKNRAKNVLPLLADARHLPEFYAQDFDRIVMNLPLSGTEFLQEGFALCKPGGMIHFYALVSSEGEHVAHIERLGGRVIAERVVRSYSPAQWHVVYDIETT